MRRETPLPAFEEVLGEPLPASEPLRAAVLVDLCNLTFMGGRMSPAERNEIIAAVRATSLDNATERMRTAVYLTLAMAQSQVDR